MDAQNNADGSQAVNAGAPDGGAVQDGGNQTPGWIAQLPDDLKGNETFTGYKTIGELAKAHLDNAGKVTELEGKVANSIPKLSENATAEERAEYFKALGVPESPDGYEFDRPQLPEGMEYNEALEKWFRNEAHTAGLSAEQAKALYGAYNKFTESVMKKMDDDRQAALDSGMKALKESWGNKYDDNVAIVKRVQEKIAGSEPMKKWLTTHNAENDPVLIQFLLDLAPGYLDDSAPPGRPAGDKTNKQTGMRYTSMTTA